MEPRIATCFVTHTSPILSPLNDEGTGKMNAEADTTKTWRQTALICVALILLTLLAYSQVRTFDFINFDDPDYVASNPHVQAGLNWSNIKWAFTSSFASNWHPLTWLSHMLDCQLFGLIPGAHHVTNVLLHTANSVILFLLFFRMTGEQWRSAILGALFALHPMHVESVAWIAERKDVLSTFFFLLTIHVYVGYSRGQRIKSYLLALILFSLALLAKPMVVTLPCLLLALDFWPLNRFQFAGSQMDERSNNTTNPRPIRLLLEKVPFALLAAASCVITFLVQKAGGAVTNDVLPFKYRAANAIVAYERYIEKLFWPSDLAAFYPHPGIWPVWRICVASMLILLISIVCFRAARRFPNLPSGWLWFLGTLVPVIGFVQVGSQSMADRYSYIPSIGFFMMIIWSIPASGPATSPILNKVLRPAIAVLLILCLGLTRLQASYWQNSYKLFSHAVRATENNATAHGQLGLYFSDAGNIVEAIRSFEAAVKINPTNALLHNNYAFALSKAGETSRAVEAFHRALMLQPKYPEAQNNLASTLALEGSFDEAARYYQLALQNRPNYPEVLNNLANVRTIQGNFPEAEALYLKALQLAPNFAQAHNNLANGLVMAGREAEAIPHWRTAARLQPNLVNENLATVSSLIGKQSYSEAGKLLNGLLQAIPNLAQAHNLLARIAIQNSNAGEALKQISLAKGLEENHPDVYSELAFALVAAGKPAEATSSLQKAISLRPDDANLYNNLANIFAMRGLLTEAASHYSSALKLKPDLEEAHYNLGNVLMMKEKVDEAIPHYQEAVRLKPAYADAHINLGEAYSKKGLTEDARRHFQTALEIAPNNLEARYKLGMVLANLRRYKEAELHLKEVIKLKPDYEDSQQQLIRIHSLMAQDRTVQPLLN